MLDFLPPDEQSPGIGDHCNGLLLLFSLLVVNPASKVGALATIAPHLRQAGIWVFDKEFIVFDTTVSPHYEVFNIQFVGVGWYNVKTMDPVLKKSEWPPSPLVLRVFSSATGRWEERSFSREGDAAGTVASAQRLCRPEQCGTVYWRGALYVNSYFVMMLTLALIFLFSFNLYSVFIFVNINSYVFFVLRRVSCLMGPIK